MDLTSSQRKYLRSLAHHLKPSVYIGKSDLTDGVINSIDNSLAAHELIKIKFHNNKISSDCTILLKDKLKCSIIGNIGKTIIIFRQIKDIEMQKIKLPK